MNTCRQRVRVVGIEGGILGIHNGKGTIDAGVGMQYAMHTPHAWGPLKLVKGKDVSAERDRERGGGTTSRKADPWSLHTTV